MKLVKKLYLKLCARLYSVGKLENDKKLLNRFFDRTTTKEKSKFYIGSNVSNLANDKRKITIGYNCHIYGSLTIMPNGGKITIGDNCSLGEYSRIVSLNSIEIGNRVMIAHNVNILDNNSHPIDANERHIDFINNYFHTYKVTEIIKKKITIEDDVWIGFNSTILKGVTIGQGAIIGAGSVVTKNVEPWTINVGNPSKCIKKLEPVEVKTRN